MPTLHIRLYSKPGCHLCENAKLLLDEARADFDFLLEEINIEEDPALTERLGTQIPVITFDGGNRVAGQISDEKLRRAFAKSVKARGESH